MIKTLRNHFQTCYSNPPNIFLNLCYGKQIVSRCQIQTRNFLYSDIPEFKGKFYGKIQPWFLVSV